MRMRADSWKGTCCDSHTLSYTEAYCVWCLLGHTNINLGTPALTSSTSTAVLAALSRFKWAQQGFELNANVNMLKGLQRKCHMPNLMLTVFQMLA